MDIADAAFWEVFVGAADAAEDEASLNFDESELRNERPLPEFDRDTGCSCGGGRGALGLGTAFVALLCVVVKFILDCRPRVFCGGCPDSAAGDCGG